MEESPRHSHRSSSRNRHRWERKTGKILELSAQALLLLCMLLLPFLWGGRHILAVGALGIGVFVCLLLWTGAVAFTGGIRFQPAKGSLVLLLFVFIGILQVSPDFSSLVMTDSLRSYWQIARDAGIATQAPILSVLPSVHIPSLYVVGLTAIFYMLLAQLFAGARSRLFVLALAISATSTLCGLASLVQHFGGYDWLFQIYKEQSSTVSGPYFNKNHFALLQEMGLFLALGLVYACIKAGKGSFVYGIIPQWTFVPLLITLGISVIVSALSIAFSGSRAGVLCSLAGVFLFFFYMVFGHRRKSLSLPLLLIFVTILLVSFYGVDLVIKRIELALSGEDFSELTRWEMWQVILDVIALSPLFGTGFGGVRVLSPFFDLSFIPGFVAFDAHNDYLELFQLVGIPCAIFVLGLFIFSFVYVVRVLMTSQARHSSLHPVAVGALLSLLVVAGHEFFDYGLKQPANLLIFLALLVLLGGLVRQFVGGIGEGEKGIQWKLSRAVYVVPVLCLIPTFVVGMGGAEYVSKGLAVTRINDLQVVPQIRKALKPESRMQTLLRQGEVSLRYGDDISTLTAMGDSHMVLANLMQTKLLSDAMGQILDRSVSLEQVWRPQYRPYLEQAFREIPYEKRRAVAEEFDKAAEFYTRIVKINPLSALPLVSVAQARDEASAWRGDPDTMRELYNAALALYPYHTSVLHKSMRGYWRAWHESTSSESRESLSRRFIELAREYGKQMPENMTAVFEMLWAMRPEAGLMVEVTPQTITGQEALANFLLEKGYTVLALEVLDCMTALNHQRPEEETPETLGNQGFLRRDRRSKLVVERLIQAQKAVTFEQIGRYEEAENCRARVNELLVVERTPRILRADALMAQGEYLLAEEVLKSILDDDRALIRYAELLFMAGRLEHFLRVMKLIESKQEDMDSDSVVRFKNLVKKAKDRGVLLSSSAPQDKDM